MTRLPVEAKVSCQIHRKCTCILRQLKATASAAVTAGAGTATNQCKYRDLDPYSRRKRFHRKETRALGLFDVLKWLSMKQYLSCGETEQMQLLLTV